MTLSELIAVLISGLSLIGMVYLGAFRMAKLESRVELLWAFLLRRGVGDALVGGVMEKSSPLRLNVDALKQHADLLARAQEFYDAEGRKLNDIALIEEMERRFGVSLVAIAAEHKMMAGGCLVALVFLMRPTMSLFKQFDTEEWHVGDGKPTEEIAPDRENK